MSTILHTRDRYRGLELPPLVPTSLWGWWSSEAAYTDAGKTTLCASSGSDTAYTLADLSGNSRDMVQATAGSRPLWKSNRLNNKPSITFDGTDDFMRRATDAISADFSIFCVFRSVTWTLNDKIYGRADNVSSFSVQQGDTTPELRVVGPGFNNANMPVNLFAATHVAANATHFSKINNTPATTTAFTPSPPTGFELASINNGAGPFGNIEFVEMLLYSGVTILDGSDAQKAVMNYLSVKYNLGFSL